MKLHLLALLVVALPAVGKEPADTSRGHQVFQYWCQACHGHGDDKPGTVALGAKYQGKLPPALEDRTDLQPEVVKHFVRRGISVMPFFRKTEISDADLDALEAYLSHRH